MSKHDSFRNLFSPTAPLPMVFNGSARLSWAQEGQKVERSVLLSATLIEAPHPQEVNYLAGKEAPSSVLVNICGAIITANTVFNRQ